MNCNELNPLQFPEGTSPRLSNASFHMSTFIRCLHSTTSERCIHCFSWLIASSHPQAPPNITYQLTASQLVPYNARSNHRSKSCFFLCALFWSRFAITIFFASCIVFQLHSAFRYFIRALLIFRFASFWLLSPLLTTDLLQCGLTVVVDLLRRLEEPRTRQRPWPIDGVCSMSGFRWLSSCVIGCGLVHV